MKKEEITNKTMEVINDPKSSSNSDLIFAMEIVQKDFESVKETLIKLTHHLDSLENTYNSILKEYNNRTNGPKRT
jgi:prefoldin subunit 5